MDSTGTKPFHYGEWQALSFGGGLTVAFVAVGISVYAECLVTSAVATAAVMALSLAAVGSYASSDMCVMQILVGSGGALINGITATAQTAGRLTKLNVGGTAATAMVAYALVVTAFLVASDVI